jgi:hypothetical protein
LNVVAVCISKHPEKWFVSEIPFYCHTEGYEEIIYHNKGDLDRLNYLTERYNRAVQRALEEYPNTDHILIVDSYYLSFATEIRGLLATYSHLDKSILGASIWFWNRSHLRPFIQYYDTLSVREMRNRKWYSVEKLPKGLLSVSGVGACFILPRFVWERSGGFFIPQYEPQAGGTRGLNIDGHSIFLDCDQRLWRTTVNNPEIPDYPLLKRARVSLGELRRRIIHQ